MFGQIFIFESTQSIAWFCDIVRANPLVVNAASCFQSVQPLSPFSWFLGPHASDEIAISAATTVAEPLSL